jgi:hypothetical protein
MLLMAAFSAPLRTAANFRPMAVQPATAVFSPPGPLGSGVTVEVEM